MVQTVRSQTILADNQMIFFERPHVLRRIFLSVKVLVDLSTWCETWLSFDDPTFSSYYMMAGPAKFFKAKGEGISQGDVWLRNCSGGNVIYTGTEILV